MLKLIRVMAAAACFAGLGHTAATPVRATTAIAPKRVLADAQIERAIRAKLGRSKVNADHFTVSVQNGVATFEGKTNVIQHKGVATRMAKTAGAVAVQNHIQISEEAKAKAAAHLAKARNNAGGAPVRASVIQAKK